jgi:uncharacterized protein
MKVLATQEPTAPNLAKTTTASSHERWLVNISVGLIALHIVDDNFLQPEPGTSATDHLVSGLVPLAVMAALVVWSYRMRPGARAIVAGLLGSFGVVVGLEAVYYVSEGYGSGDDYTGLLAAAGGLVLIGCALTVLWRSRRVDDRRVWRYPRRLLLGLATLICAYVVLVPLAVSYVATHTATATVTAADLGAPYEDVEFTTSDGLTLRGWYVPSRNGAAVIVLPGLSGRSSSPDEAKMLVGNGYGVLLFDRRGEGESEGDPNMFGWAAPTDVHAAVEFLQNRPDVDPDRIGGIGFSVGGETLIQAAAESDALAAIVSEGGSGRSLREDLNYSGSLRWQAAPFSAVITMGTATFSNQLPPPNLKDLMAQIAPQSVFLIYAADGQQGEVELTDDYYAAADEPKEIWEVPEGGHTGGFAARPREYEQRVTAFFDSALLGRR